MTLQDLPNHAVIWHDAECGGYHADEPLWLELAASCRSPRARVLDVGAGTGRISLLLAAEGHDVTSLDLDPALVAELRRRAWDAGLAIETHVADARDFHLVGAEPFDLVIVPMQTLQLLGGPGGRRPFLRQAHRHLKPNGLVAAALADPLEGLEGDRTEPPLPDLAEWNGWHFSSQPVHVRLDRDELTVTIERIRQTRSPDGRLTAEGNEIRLDVTSPQMIAREAAPLGYRALAPRRIEATEEHVGSDVVVLCRD